MGEFARVFLDKRIVIVSIALLILNGLMFFESAKYETPQQKAGYLSYVDMLHNENKEQTYEDALQKVNSWNKKNEEYFNSSIINGDLEYNVNEYFSDKEMEEYYTNSIYVDKYQYAVSYDEHIDYVIKNAEDMKSSNILYEEGSFSKANIDKTQKDFSAMKNIDVSMGNDRWVENIVNYDILEYFALILVIVGVIVIVDERKKGLWETVYATKNGRCILAIKRFMLITVLAFAGVMILAAENIIIASSLSGGVGDIFRSIQSIEMMKNVTMEINIFQFVILIYLWKAISIAIVGMFFYILATSIKSHIMPMLVLLVVLAGELLLFRTIQETSTLAALKYINIVSGFFSQNIMFAYKNISILGNAVGSYGCMVTTGIVLYIFLGLIMSLLGSRKPFSVGEGVISRQLSNISYKLKLYRHNSLFIHEMHKQLWIVRVLFVLIVMMLVSILNINTDEVKYGYADNVYIQYMEILEGEVTSEKQEYIKNEKSIWQEKYDETQQELSNLIENGNNVYQIEATQKKLEQYIVSMQVVSEIDALCDRLLKLEDNGADAEFINEIGYDNYLGEKSFDINQKATILNMLFVVFAVSGIYAYENSQSGKLLTYPTKYGRGRFAFTKCAGTFVITLFIFIVSSIAILYEVNEKYGLGGMTADARSVYLFEDFSIGCPIWLVILGILTLRFILLYIMSLVIMFISSRSKNYITAILVSTIIFMVPAMLVYMGYGQLEVISILDEFMVNVKWR